MALRRQAALLWTPLILRFKDLMVGLKMRSPQVWVNVLIVESREMFPEAEAVVLP